MTMNMIVRCLVVLSVAHAIGLLTIGGAAAYNVEKCLQSLVSNSRCRRAGAEVGKLQPRAEAAVETAYDAADAAVVVGLARI